MPIKTADSLKYFKSLSYIKSYRFCYLKKKKKKTIAGNTYAILKVCQNSVNDDGFIFLFLHQLNFYNVFEMPGFPLIVLTFQFKKKI